MEDFLVIQAFKLLLMSQPFIHENFLLDTKEAQVLYHQYAKDLPIIDYHSHLDPVALAENRTYDNISQLWLEADHYKWRAMRANGVSEAYCSGKGLEKETPAKTDKEKFFKWAETVPKLLRNPLYHWTHLELKRPFGIDDCLLNADTAEDIWQRTEKYLQSPGHGALDILQTMNVESVCTTDDPTDDLAAHQSLRNQNSPILVLPTFRPDRARATQNPVLWNEWVDKLALCTGQTIETFTDFTCALKSRHDYFGQVGARLSDHSLEFLSEEVLTDTTTQEYFLTLRQGKALSPAQQAAFSQALMRSFAQWDAEKGWVMQLHLGALRNPNSWALEHLGVDTGFDAIADFPIAASLSILLNSMEEQKALPKTILYNLNPKDSAVLAVLVGSFQDGSVAGKIQYGAAWWFLDQLDGMRQHLETLSQLGLLSRFVGMLTDSRSFLSYTRHEYFRRLLCQILGREMKDGLIPSDEALVGTMVQDICYYNAKNYFRFA